MFISTSFARFARPLLVSRGTFASYRKASLPPPARASVRALTILLTAAVMSLSLPLLAHAGIPDKPATMINNIVTMLTGLGVGLFTAACMWTGYKMAFAGAQFRDVSNILWGGVLAGGAAGFAGWLFS